MGKSIGIDLGTTNSVIAFMDGKEPRVLQTRDNKRSTPSVVAYRKSKKDPTQGEFLIGFPALAFAKRDPLQTVYSIKRLMGRDFHEKNVKDVKENFNYQIVKSDEDEGVSVLLGGKKYTPIDISAMILKKLKEDAENALGEEVTHTVITVPAYFEERQREATRKAGEQAGLIVKKIIDEPTAAAIAYGVSAPEERHRILVFDLGGGTFDVSIIQGSQYRYRVLQTEGNNWLGGDDFDEAIRKEIENRCNIPSLDDPRYKFVTKEEVQKCKENLSTSDEIDIIVPAAYRGDDGRPVDIEESLNREEFEKLIVPFVHACMDQVHKALKDQSLDPEDISAVLLVGGSTAIPAFRKALINTFGSESVKTNVNPMECVALGASILAAELKEIDCPRCKTINPEGTTQCQNCGEKFLSKEIKLQEVTPMAFGIQAVEGEDPDVFVPLIPKGTRYPLKEPAKKIFYLTSDNQVRVPVYEGNSQKASENSCQGFIEFPLPPGLEEKEEVEVVFNYDKNRNLTVKVWIKGTSIQEEKNFIKRHQAPVEILSSREPREEKWRGDLQHMIKLTTLFLQQQQEYLEVKQRGEIEKTIAEAREAYMKEDREMGVLLTQTLNSLIFDSGIASEIFKAECIMAQATPEDGQIIGGWLDSFKDALKHGRKEDVERLGKKLTLATVQALHKVSRAGADLHEKIDYKGLLKKGKG